MMTGEGTSSRRGVRPSSTRCVVRAPSQPSRSLLSRHPGCRRTPPRWPSLARLRTSRRPRGHRGRPLALAQTGVTTSPRCASAWGCVGMGAARDASGGGRAPAARGWRRRWRLRRAWPWVWRGGVGAWRSVRPRVAARWEGAWSPRSRASRSSHGPRPSARHAQPGDDRQPPCPAGGRSRGGPRTRPPGAGLAAASSVRWRSHTALGASPRRLGALSWCMRGNGRRRTPSALPRPQGTQPPPWQRPCGLGTPGGAPVAPLPQRRSPRMTATGRATAGAAPAGGGRRRDALASSPIRAVGAAPVGGGPHRPTHPGPSRASAAWSQARRWPRLKRTRGGPCAPPPSTRRSGLLARCSRPLTTNIPPSNLAVAGASPPRRLPPYGWRSPHGSRPERGGRSWACWATA